MINNNIERQNDHNNILFSLLGSYNKILRLADCLHSMGYANLSQNRSKKKSTVIFQKINYNSI